MTHDEVLMLIIAGAVIIQIATTFHYLRRVPYAALLLGSFGMLVLNSFFSPWPRASSGPGCAMSWNIFR